jgi:hypothetical protein
MSAKTVFSRNVNPVYKKTILDKQYGFVEDDIYRKLAIYTIQLDCLFHLFSHGQFSQIVLLLTRDRYNQLALELFNLSRPNNVIYEQIRSTIAKALEGLYQGVLQYILLINTQYALIKANNKASILDDVCKIKKYLEQMKESLSILPDREVSIVRATVKPEYLEYIRLYGYPEGGVFEVDKLAEILSSL